MGSKMKCAQVCFVMLALLSVALPSFAKKKREPLASMSFVVLKEDNGKPVRNAAVVLHPVDEDGKQLRNGLELKTDSDGKANFDGVPYGRLRIQVLADGFQTYGEDYDVDKPSLDVTVKMKRPAKQYSIYEEHPEQKKPEDDKKPQ
jgi:hypothetical protein